jgi:hypothetical protein
MSTATGPLSLDATIRRVIQEWEKSESTDCMDIAEPMRAAVTEATAVWIEQQSYGYHYGWTGDSMRTLAKRLRTYIL